MAEKITGSFSIEIDSQELNAELVFSFDPDGEEWNDDKIKQLIQSKNIKEGFTQELFTEAIKSIKKVKEGSSKFIIAKGLPPTPHEPESVEWKDLNLPEDLVESAESVLKKADSPEIYKIKIEKIKKQHVEKVKSKLPFMADKEKTVETIEKKESKERVYVDPELINKAWVEADVLIADLFPAKPGKAGRSIFGKMVQPKELKESSFLVGNGVEKRKGALYSKYTGFLRIGKNWADIIPFKKFVWDVYLSEEKSTCLLDFYPGEEIITPPTAEELLNKAIELGIDPETLMEEEDLNKIIFEHSESKKSLSQYSISKDKDAFFEIKIKDNDLKAILNVEKGRGNGTPLVLKELGQEINSKSLKGLDIKKIQSDILAFYKSEALEILDYVLVEGKEPTVGEDQACEVFVDFVTGKSADKLKESFNNLKEEALKEIKSLEKFPLEKVQKMVFVKKDEPIFETAPLKKGENGVDVFGKILEGKTGKEYSYELLENLKQEKNLVISLIDGLLETYEEDGKNFFRVRFHEDADLELSISHDKMSARLEFRRELGSGKALDLAFVKEFIKQKGIVKDINEELIESKLTAFNEGQEIDSFAFAQGVEPVNSAEAKLEFLITLASGKGVKIRKDGKADYKNQDKLTTVKKGEKIAEIILSNIVAQNGYDIFGKELAAKKLPSVPVNIGKNIIQEKEGENKIVLIAEAEGQLFYDKKTMHIDNQLNIKSNIGLSTGNIKFPGDINIGGSVESGFKVISGGSLKIAENVEASLVSADGSVEVVNGIKGYGKAVVRAKENINIGFAEQAHLLAVGDINVKNFCLRCEVKCNGKLQLTGEKGNLVGGQVKSRSGLVLNNIGSENGIKTAISFGQDYLVEDQIRVEEKEIKNLNDKILKINKYIKLMEHKNNKAEIVKTGQEKVKILKIIEKRGMRLFTLRERFEEHFKSEIIVNGTAYPGTLIESHGRTFEFNKSKKSIVIFFDEKLGHIQTRPISE